MKLAIMILKSLVHLCMLLGSAALASSQAAFDSFLPSALAAQAVSQESMLTIEVPFRPSSPGYSSSLTAEELIASQNGSFVRLIHPEFPGTSVRIKRHGKAWEKGRPADTDPDAPDPETFCDPTVVSYTGYVDAEDGRSLFFFFFESRSNPAEDPVVMWTNGGPGASGAFGLFKGHGPCRVLFEDREGPPINGTEYFESSWTQKANVVFMEQPVGVSGVFAGILPWRLGLTTLTARTASVRLQVGFSYQRFGEPTSDSWADGLDVYHFFRIFFATFEKLRDNDFHLTGESYGGRYIPTFASVVVDKNDEIARSAAKEGKQPEPGALLNLKTIAVGNGGHKMSIWRQAMYDTGCTGMANEGPPRQSIAHCAALRPWVALCEKTTRQHCEEEYSEAACLTWYTMCWDKFVKSWDRTPGLDYLDMHSSDGPSEEQRCPGRNCSLARYLRREDVRALIGAPPREQLPDYLPFSEEVGMRFKIDFLHLTDSFNLHAQLLERGIKVLIYVGRADYVCGYLYSLRTADIIEYPGAIDFAKSLQPWHYKGMVVGDTATGGNLSE